MKMQSGRRGWNWGTDFGEMRGRYAQSAPFCPILADPLLVISFAAKKDAFIALGWGLAAKQYQL
jgi:hypothetical protein